MTNKPQIQKVYDLSPMQEGMLFHCQLDASSNVYFEQTVFTLKGYIDIELFEKSFNEIIKRHDILRTIFFFKNVQKFSQVVLKERSTTIYFKDVTELENEAKIKYVRDFLEKDRRRGFDLSRDILIRISILKTTNEQYKLIWSFHHILMDGWCLGIINKEILEIYSSLINNTVLKLKEPPAYKNYINWLKTQNKEAARLYWTEYLKDYEGHIMLPSKHMTKDAYEYKKEDLYIKINDDIAEGLSNIAKKSQATLNTVFQAIWGIILQKYNYADDVVFGAVVSGRGADIEDIEDMVGLFINTLPIRIQCDNNISFTELILKIQEESLSSEKFSYLSLSDIQQCSIQKSTLINHILVYENYPLSKKLDSTEDNSEAGFAVESFETFEQTNYDLNVIIVPNSDKGIEIVFKFNSCVYDRNFIEALGRQITQISRSIIQNADIKVYDLDIVSSEEQSRILLNFNNTRRDYPYNKTIDMLFEEQTVLTPDKTAVAYEDKKLTYKQLNAKANQLARLLLSKKVKSQNKNRVAAVMTDYSIEAIVGMLAVLKAGYAYLPIAYEYPKERIQHMLMDSNAEMLLTQTGLNNNLEYNGEIIYLDHESIYQGNENNLDNVRASHESAASPLAYIMYTSGSTGTPKGVLIEHKSIVRLVKNVDYISFKDDDRILQTGAIVFDACTFEIWGALLNGLELHIIDKHKLLDAEQLENKLVSNKITILWLTSSLFSRLGQQKPELFESLRYLLVGGDVVSPKYINMIKSKFTNLNIINCYGPTENTTFSTYYSINKEHEHNIPIGKPISNSKVYIFDRLNKLCPIGAVGELCTAGDGLARGYLNNPELTAQKFVENPYCKGEIMYRTGDLARWLPDGNIEFLGRIDNQIKLRGYRIELSEIESRLISYEGIREAVVILKEDNNNNKYLCAYFTSEEDIDKAAIREFLVQKLPEYMIPAYFVQLNCMPVNINGKLDRKLLPEPIKGVKAEYEAPRNELEEKLISLWKKALDVDALGINDNFFELGGDSIKAMQLVSLLQKELNSAVSLSEIFNNPTISGISRIINPCKACIHNELIRLPHMPHYDLSYSQKRLWIINQLEADSNAYNMPGRIRLTNCDNEAIIINVLKELSQRHEAFRTSFQLINGEPKQIIADIIEFNIDIIDLTERKKEEKEALLNEIYDMESHKGFDLQKPPLMRVKFVRLDVSELEIIFVMHHIISDGFSLNILKNEFEAIYKQQKNGHTSNLQPLKLQYKDFAAWQNSYIQKHSDEAREYWNKKLSAAPATLRLPVNAVLKDNVSKKSAGFRAVINKDIKSMLANQAKANSTSLFTVLLTAFTAFLSNLTAQENVLVGIPSLGREHEELKNVIGYFVSTLILTNTVDMETKFTELLKAINKDILKALEYQYYPLELAVEELKISYPQIRVFFNMINFSQNKESSIQDCETYHLDKLQEVKFDIVFYLTEYKDGIEILCGYRTELFESSRIQMLVINYVRLLEEIAKNPASIVKDYFRSEKRKILKRK